MDQDVLACVLDDELTDRIQFQAAFLSGYRRVKLPHETYPLLIPDAQGVTEGRLIRGLNSEELKRIVFFEGEEYELSPCQVKTLDSVADALFFDEGVMPPAISEEWNFKQWQQVHKAYLIRQSKVYMSWYGKMSAREADIYWQNYSE